MIAKTIMDRHFHFLTPEQSLKEAVCQFEKAGREEGKMIFGMMVINEKGLLAGMVSMYDILQSIRPRHIDILGEMEDLSFEPVFKNMLSRINHVTVAEIMTMDLVTVGPDTHLMVIIDLMVKKHIRRMPVVEEGKVVGVLYRSDVFNYLMQQIIKE